MNKVKKYFVQKKTAKKLHAFVPMYIDSVLNHSMKILKSIKSIKTIVMNDEKLLKKYIIKT